MSAYRKIFNFIGHKKADKSTAVPKSTPVTANDNQTTGYKAGANDKYKSFTELAHHRKEGEDYTIVTHEIPNSKIAIVAPHGGGIDPSSGAMAEAIAADDFSLYVFSGILPENNFSELHVTSIHFDEPRCLDLVAKSDITLTIHGCRGEEPAVYLSALDKKLESSLSAAFNKASIKAQSQGHIYQTGTLPENICNKNRQKQGVQLEFTRAIRGNPALKEKCVHIVRETLQAYAA